MVSSPPNASTSADSAWRAGSTAAPSATGIPGHRDHVRAGNRIAFAVGGDEYDHNIQIADLNMLNAALVVIKFKKLCGFYADDERELFTAWTIAASQLLNDDRAS